MDDLIGPRIMYVRRSLGLTQRKFAELLGVRAAYISMLEKNRKTPSEQLILGICRTFHVMREWLREGKGRIWDKSSDTKGSRLIDEIKRRLQSADRQVSASTVAKLLGIDTRSFKEERAAPLANDEIERAVQMLIAIFGEGNKKKIDAVMSQLHALTPEAGPARGT